MKREEEEIRDDTVSRSLERNRRAEQKKRESAFVSPRPRQSRFPGERERERDIRFDSRSNQKREALRRRRGGKERQRARESERTTQTRRPTTHVVLSWPHDDAFFFRKRKRGGGLFSLSLSLSLFSKSDVLRALSVLCDANCGDDLGPNEWHLESRHKE